MRSLTVLCLLTLSLFLVGCSSPRVVPVYPDWLHPIEFSVQTKVWLTCRPWPDYVTTDFQRLAVLNDQLKALKPH